MARQTNAMITYNDAIYMVANEGFLEFEPIPVSNQCMTSEEIRYYMNADVEKFETYENKRLVPYHLLSPFGNKKACGSSFTKGTSTRLYHQVNIDFGTEIGNAVLTFIANSTPKKFDVTWNKITYTTGWIGSDTSYYNALISAGYDDSEINLGSTNGAGSIVVDKNLANPTSVQVIVNEFVDGDNWSGNGNCI
jgi:hypothetical protein